MRLEMTVLEAILRQVARLEPAAQKRVLAHATAMSEEGAVKASAEHPELFA